jgi:hypothetical protein
MNRKREVGGKGEEVAAWIQGVEEGEEMQEGEEEEEKRREAE